jgi:hypothetical protein
MVVDSDTVTDGGVTDGGVSGDRRFIWQVGVVVEGIRGAGNEINVGGCSSETAANFEAEVELQSEERLRLFEAMTCAVNTNVCRSRYSEAQAIFCISLLKLIGWTRPASAHK